MKVISDMQRVTRVIRREGWAGAVRRAGLRLAAQYRVVRRAHPLRWYVGYRLNPARHTGRPPADPAAIHDALLEAGIPLEEIRVPVDAYREYVQAAQYSPAIYGDYFYHVAGKSLEHFLSLCYLETHT